MMELLPETNEILKKVQDLTNKDFDYVFNPKLNVLGKVKIARQKMDHHIIYYRENNSRQLNHIIAHECGHIIRIFESDPSYRVIPYTNSTNYELALKDMKADIEKISKLLPKSKVDGLIQMLFNGLISQVTNLPVDLKIEEWIYKDYPGLREFQFITLEKQMDDAIAGIDKKIESIIPSKIYNSSHIMNYAYFTILTQITGYKYIKNFKGHSFELKANKLIEIFERYDTKINLYGEGTN